jgi:hypothetical protein
LRSFGIKVSDRVNLDLRQALDSAAQARKARGFFGLVDWLWDSDFSVPEKVGVFLVYARRMEEEHKDVVLVGFAKAVMGGKSEDPDLVEGLQGHALLKRSAALNRLARYKDAWSLLASALVDHLRDPNPGVYLPPLLAVSADSTAGLGSEETAGQLRSLAVEADALPDGSRSPASFANLLCLVLRENGRYRTALRGLTDTLESFGRDGSDPDLRATMAGRADTLLTLGLLEECVDACVDLLEALANRADEDAEPLRLGALATEALALVRLGHFERAVVVASRFVSLPGPAEVILGNLAGISKELLAAERWQEALDVVDLMETAAREHPDDETRSHIGRFEIIRAELLNALDEHERAAAVRRSAQLEYGEDLVAHYDQALSDARGQIEPDALRLSSQLLFAKADVLDGWDDSRLQETLDRLSDLYQKGGLMEIDGETSDWYSAARERWPEHFTP